ncbi:hypothetical protein Tco_0971141 [Tanacetum coccineum]
MSALMTIWSILTDLKVKDTTARDRAVVSENKGKGVNVVKGPSACCLGNPQQKEYKEKGVIDSIKMEFSVLRLPQQNGVAESEE